MDGGHAPAGIRPARHEEDDDSTRKDQNASDNGGVKGSKTGLAETL